MREGDGKVRKSLIQIFSEERHYLTPAAPPTCVITTTSKSGNIIALYFICAGLFPDARHENPLVIALTSEPTGTESP